MIQIFTDTSANLPSALCKEYHINVLPLYYYIDGKEYTFEGRVDGTIPLQPTGTEGFGYDPVFAPNETGITFASMGVEAKNRISHRARAVQALCRFLMKADEQKG